MKETLFFNRNISSLIILQAIGVFSRGFLTNLIKELILPSINDIFGDPKFTFLDIDYDISETINYLILLILGIYIIKLYNKPLKPDHFIIKYLTNIDKKTVTELNEKESVNLRIISSIYGLLSVLSFFILIVFSLNISIKYFKNSN
jgi:hypothetical protein